MSKPFFAAPSARIASGPSTSPTCAASVAHRVGACSSITIVIEHCLFPQFPTSRNGHPLINVGIESWRRRELDDLLGRNVGYDGYGRCFAGQQAWIDEIEDKLIGCVCKHCRKPIEDDGSAFCGVDCWNMWSLNHL